MSLACVAKKSVGLEIVGDAGRFLPTIPTLPEKFERMADLRKPVLLFDLALNSLYRTRIDHDSHPSTFSADDMVVMALRVDQPVVAAGTVQGYLLSDLQALQEGHHPKHRGIIWCVSVDFGSRLNFIERKRFLRS